MTQSSASKASRGQPGRWALQNAKARFSELVRKAQTEGPQHVSVHGRDSVVVISAEEFRKLKGEPTGQAIVDAFAASPFKEIDLERPRVRVRIGNIER